MKRIISVSRRTDIPAFYEKWFMSRVKSGFAGYVNPFGGQRYLVSLKGEDIACFVFWSKNYSPFMGSLSTLRSSGYKFICHYTITGLPPVLEPNVPDTNAAVRSFIQMSKMFSPGCMTWRYDPIILSPDTDWDHHLTQFKALAEKLAGSTSRCTISFVTRYGKVRRNFKNAQKQRGLHIAEPGTPQKQDFAEKLARIARQQGMDLFSCCNDSLLGQGVKKSACIDGRLLAGLFPKMPAGLKPRPSRKDCGCWESTDIGAYDTCAHGCLYCYANKNKEKAEAAYRRHDDRSAFLGQNLNTSEKWLKEEDTKWR